MSIEYCEYCLDQFHMDCADCGSGCLASFYKPPVELLNDPKQ